MRLYFVLKTSSYALFPRNFNIFAYFATPLIHSSRQNDICFSYLDDVSAWRQFVSVSLSSRQNDICFSYLDDVSTWRQFVSVSLSSRQNDICFSYLDDVSTWRQFVSGVLLSPNHSYQFNSRRVSTHLGS